MLQLTATLLLSTSAALGTNPGPLPGVPPVGDLVVGRPFPDIELPTIDGKRLRLSDLRGEPLLLFEFASW